jgi:hypothetical protein
MKRETQALCLQISSDIKYDNERGIEIASPRKVFGIRNDVDFGFSVPVDSLLPDSKARQYD